MADSEVNVVVAILSAFLIAAAWLSLLGLGAIAIWRGFHGPYADRHLCCRRCGYPLVGAVQLPPRCTECGYALAGPESFVRGPRRRRWSLIACGAVMIILCVAPASLLYSPAAAKPVAANPAAANAAAKRRARVRAKTVIARPQSQVFARPILVLPDQVRSLNLDIELERAGRSRPQPSAATKDPGPDRPTPVLVKKKLWHHLRNVQGCCPNCGSPVVTPNQITLCHHCGVDLEE